MNITETRSGEPFMGLWFGNFYRPAYDDRPFVDASMEAICAMGFNSVQLDSKAWADFQARYAGGEASEYVAQQEYMMEALGQAGLSHHFMALYLNGDNLYPNIRFSPPIYGESVQKADGTDGRWYKYWAEQAKASMAEHVKGLLSLYRKGHTQVQINEKAHLPICSMWDPIVAPSFDAEGQARYITWLKKRYGEIDALNAAYGREFSTFDGLTPQDYWFEARYGENACYDADDLAHHTPRFALWSDNMRWRADELVAFFADMKARLHAVDPHLFLMPNMAQWSYFLNIDPSAIDGIGFSDLWDTAMRGIDIYRLAEHVDMCHFYAVPVTPQGDPNAYVVSCQHAMIRAMNRNRPFLGGIYWGRFLYNDIYNFVTPAEIIGAIAASGASGINAYGYCGLDDGGILHRMDEGFVRSLSTGNHWARRVIPRIRGERKKDVAILFPQAMALLEPLRVAGAQQRRLDLLGLFTLCSDMGYAPDVVCAQDIVNGQLASYAALLLPANDCYDAMPDKQMEAAIDAFVRAGGIVIHGAKDQLARAALGCEWMPSDDTSYAYAGEGGLLLADARCCYAGEALAVYPQSGKTCIAKHSVGGGVVYSFGFMPGYQYSARIAPHVPLSQRNNELYPFTHMRHNPLVEILTAHVPCGAPVSGKNIEVARFENGMVLVNHSSHPLMLTDDLQGMRDFQYDVDGRTLMAHSAVWIEKEA